MSNSLLSSLAQNSGPKPQHKVQDIVWVDYSGTKFGPIPPWPGTVVSVAEGTVEVRFNDGSSDLFIVDRVMPFAGISCASYSMAANGEDFESEPAPRNDSKMMNIMEIPDFFKQGSTNSGFLGVTSQMVTTT